MKRKFRICTVLMLTFWIGGVLFLTGCKEEPEVPTLTTTTASDITINAAKTGGEITSDGGAEVTARGICWGTSSQPSLTGPHTSDGKGDGSFSSSLNGLTSATTYYTRAFAVNKAGTGYGNEVSFTTVTPSVPVLTTHEVLGITSTTAVSGGNITSDGGSPVTARGVCWATTENPTISNSKTTNGSGTGDFASDLTGLQPGTIYHVRAYATNSIGTAYGNDVQFTALAVPPSVTTSAVSSVTLTTAVSGGNVTNTGGAPVTARGVCWSTTSGPIATGFHTTDGSGTGSFISNISGLSPNTTYYLRAYATNNAGTSYGTELSFNTSPVTAPSVTTSAVSNVTLTSAVAGGNVTSDNGAAVTVRGVCWNTTGNPTTANYSTSDGTGTGVFTSNISGLTSGTVYYVRAYATNSAGTGYGSQIRFSTSISDIDGNNYKTVPIGTQVWMAENLKTTRYRDDGYPAVPNVTDATAWSTLTTDAYCWYENLTSYRDQFGGLYNWFAVNKGTLCPTGWKVPTDEEFKTLEKFLGMTQEQADLYSIVERGTDQGTKMKSITGWYSGGNGTNSSGFNGLPGGYRYGADGGFYDLGKLSYWWSSTEYEYDPAMATYRRLNYDITGVLRQGTSKKGGKYIRCIKN